MNKEDKDKIVKDFIPKIKAWALRLSYTLPDFIERDELYSAGCLGLVESISRYDTSRNTSFVTYAEKRIKGAMLDTLRKTDHLPKHIRKNIKELEKTISDVGKKLGKNPTNADIVEYSTFSEKEVYDYLNLIETDSIISLDLNLGENEKISLIELIKSYVPGPEATFEKNELIVLIGKEIDKLSKKERFVILLYYYEELTMREIGAILELTESRVSQMHTKAIKKITSKLREMV